MTGILAWEQALGRAAGVWHDGSEELRGAATSLDGVDVTLLGARVLPEALTFFSQWLGRVQALRSDAVAHAAALEGVFGKLAVPDAETVRTLTALLPYGDPAAHPDGLL